MSVRGKLAGAALAATLIPSGAAFAAGNGYGPGNPVVNQPGYGFVKVVTAQTVSPRGGKIFAKDGHDLIVVNVPKSAFGKSTQIEIAGGNTRMIDSVVSRKFKLDAAYGVTFKGAHLKKPVTITIDSKRIPANAVVYELVGKKLVHVKYREHKGYVSITVRGNESLVVLTPVAKPHHHAKTHHTH